MLKNFKDCWPTCNGLTLLQICLPVYLFTCKDETDALFHTMYYVYGVKTHLNRKNPCKVKGSKRCNVLLIASCL